mgnify:CR=1 FL=1
MDLPEAGRLGILVGALLIMPLVTLVHELGHEVAAVTGRPETGDYLKGLGATQIVAREEIAETVKRPLESELWGGCVDAVGGAMLARVLGQMKYGASVAAVGLAGGAQLPATVVPFLLRGVNLLGIDSVMQPYDNFWVNGIPASTNPKRYDNIFIGGLEITRIIYKGWETIPSIINAIF